MSREDAMNNNIKKLLWQYLPLRVQNLALKIALRAIRVWRRMR